MRIVSTQKYTLKTFSVSQDTLIYVVQGKKQLINLRKNLKCKHGQLLLIAANTQWDVINDPDGSSRYLAYAVGFPQELVREFGLRHTISAPQYLRSAQVVTANAQIQEAVLRLHTEGLAPVSEAVFQHRLLEVLLLLKEQGICFLSRHEMTWADQVKQLVAQQPDHDWNTASIASHFNMSASSLQRRLRTEQLSIAQIVRESRLEVALALLQSTTMQLGEIAERCGWDSHSRFSAMFKRRWGVTPSQVKASLTENA